MRTRSLAEVSPADRRWFDAPLARLRSLGIEPDDRLARFAPTGGRVLISRAPGRLDVMGGIADYSGSLVLELPLAVSTFAILQKRGDDRIELVSFRPNGPHFFSTTLDTLTRGELGTPEDLRARLSGGADAWAAYVLGTAQLCARMAAETDPDGAATRKEPRSGGGFPARGFSMVLGSSVPEGKGVSSSAALEVASMGVIATHFGLDLDASEMAASCQWVENHVVGAPCGIMDQLTSVAGRADRLLRLRCQPARVEGHLPVPSAYRFYGIDSGERHSVSGDAYGTVRAAAFMGYRMIAEAAGLSVSRSGERVVVEDRRWNGYLANVSPRELAGDFAGQLPERITGEEFLARFAGHTDPATRVRRECSYPIRAATSHPIAENARVQRFAELLERLPGWPEGAEEMGSLMYDSHASYGACGLGSGGTDRLVELVREAGAPAGLFGAKITGGGSGGTVAVFGRRDADAAVRGIAARYGREADVLAEVFLESGPGFERTGVVEF